MNIKYIYIYIQVQILSKKYRKNLNILKKLISFSVTYFKK